MTDPDTRVWVAERHPLTVWACAAGPPGHYEYVATVATSELAAQIVAEHNRCTTPPTANNQEEL